jgi:hypothetical protein
LLFIYYLDTQQNGDKCILFKIESKFLHFENKKKEQARTEIFRVQHNLANFICYDFFLLES